MTTKLPPPHIAALLAAALTAIDPRSVYALTIDGADGSDGVLNITASTEIDLSQAVTANWDADNSANAGKGVYDPAKWAVVFKYSSVNIAASATVTFKNHASRAPVVWLVSGDVTIAGVLSLNSVNPGYNSPNLAEPGPGGFRGGQGYFSSGVGRSAGFGPGGGANTNPSNSYGAAGSYGTLGTYGSSVYGNPSLLPLIGGSGGGGYYNDARGGGGGAGAILVASAGTTTVSGTIRANGGSDSGGGGGGSGGGVRLIANALGGAGIVQCLGGAEGSYAGGLGRIRIERVTNTSALQVNPSPSVVPLEAGATPLIWLPETGPTARVVSIGSVVAPEDPRATFGAQGADVTLPLVAATQVVVETENAEQQSVVKVRVTPRANANHSEVTATFDQQISANPLVLRWIANLTVNPGYSAVQARVIRP
ncbi:MAG: hypothetical protein L0Z50_41685 [Verrucomicrobiales bacterium]|nr:hypothetical protein [Verrucomicrobiales bacterium]